MQIDLNEVKWDEINTKEVKWDDKLGNEKASPLWAIPSGINSILPGILGLPVDLTTNLLNQFTSTSGPVSDTVRFLAGKDVDTGSLVPYKEPLLNPDQIGGSKDIARRLDAAGRAVIEPVLGPQRSAFENPRPDSRLSQGLYTGSAVLSGALLNPAQSVRQAAVNVRGMVPAAAGAAGAEQVSDSPLAPVVGAIAPGAARLGVSALSSKAAQVNPQKLEIFKQARKEGLVVPPSDLKSSITGDVVNSFGFKAATRQSMSIKNSKVVNRLIQEDLDIPKKTVITEKVLQDLRTEAGNSYKAVKESGVEIKTNSAFKEKLQKIGGDFEEAAKEVPELINNKEVEKIITVLSKKEKLSATAAVQLSRKFRDQASQNLKSYDNAANLELGLAQRKAADLIDDLIGENLESAGKVNLFSEWKAARQKIAKVHDAESAFNSATGDFDARIYAKLKDKGTPLSGKSKLVADFAEAFPFAVQPANRAGGAGVSRLLMGETALFGAGGIASLGPEGVALAAIPLTVPPLTRAVMRSGVYQNNLIPRKELPRGLLPAGLLSQRQ